MQWKILIQRPDHCEGVFPYYSTHQHLNISSLVARTPWKWKPRERGSVKERERMYERMARENHSLTTNGCLYGVPQCKRLSHTAIVPSNELISVGVPLSMPHHSLNIVQEGLHHCGRWITSLYEIDYIIWT